MANQVIRITLKAYDHQLIDQSAKKIIETAKKTGANVSGPVPLPTKKERTHKRLIDVLSPSQKTVDALSKLEMPAGVFINLKVMN